MIEILLWLFVVNLGIAFGAGLYESRIVVPQWLTYSPESGYHWNAEAARTADVGLRFWVYVTTVPLTLLTLVSLVAAWWAPDSIRAWWLAAAVAALVDRGMTFAYFIPTMIRLAGEENSGKPKAAAEARRWVRLGFVRHAATLAAWLAALTALAMTGNTGS